MKKIKRERWSKEFSKWFDEVLEKAELYDYGRYPIKGMGIWRPYGFKLRKLVLELIRREHDTTGHEEVLLPLLIPEHYLRKESEHIRGFEAQVYWVTHGGVEELDVKLALRPTSETIITPMVAYWYQSYKQLPRKFYQIGSIFRYETKATRPMIRLREVTTFKEAHTFHDSFEDAERQVKEAIGIYRRIFDALGIPYVISQRPEWDKFAGALYTIAFDTIMPDGKVLQIGTVHHLGQNFTKAFEARIQQEDGTIDYMWSTSYGISDRIIATLISVHGDDRGLVLLPKIAPIQVVIIPIPSKDEEKTKKIIDYARKVRKVLEDNDIRVYVDEREEVTPGYKYYDWEMRGVPVRIEVGERELSEEKVTLVRRDLLIRTTVNFNELVEKVRELFNEIEKYLKSRAREFFNSKLRFTKTLEEAIDIINTQGGIVEVPWCGNLDCGLEIEARTGLRVLGRPIKDEEKYVKERVSGHKCPVCGKPAKTILRLAKTY